MSIFSDYNFFEIPEIMECQKNELSDFELQGSVGISFFD